MSHQRGHPLHNPESQHKPSLLHRSSSSRALGGDAQGKGTHFHPFPLGKLEQKGATQAPESWFSRDADGQSREPSQGLRAPYARSIPYPRLRVQLASPSYGIICLFIWEI